jgi:hypothetical protein
MQIEEYANRRITKKRMNDGPEPMVLDAKSIKAGYSNPGPSRTWLEPRSFYLIIWRRYPLMLYVVALDVVG